MTIPDYATIAEGGWRITNLHAVQAPDLSVWLPYAHGEDPLVGMRLFWVNHGRKKVLPYSWQGWPIAPTNPPCGLRDLCAGHTGHGQLATAG